MYYVVTGVAIQPNFWGWILLKYEELELSIFKRKDFKDTMLSFQDKIFNTKRTAFELSCSHESFWNLDFNRQLRQGEDKIELHNITSPKRRDHK